MRSSLKLGLFSYPVLQAADILVHRYNDSRSYLSWFCANRVLQEQHTFPLEMTSGNTSSSPESVCPTSIARTASTSSLRQPFPVSIKTVPGSYGVVCIRVLTLSSTAPDLRIMSLQNPTQKMSKSDKSHWSRILITDTPEEISKKVMSAVTDSDNFVSYDPATRPGVSNLLRLLSFFEDGGRTPEQIATELSSKNVGLGVLKQRVAESTIAAMEGIRERYLQLLAEDDGGFIDHVAKEGARKARLRAAETMSIVREAVGL